MYLELHTTEDHARVLTWYVEICWFSSLMVVSYSVKSGASILQRYINELDRDCCWG